MWSDFTSRTLMFLAGTSFVMLAVLGCLGTESGNPPKVNAALKIQAVSRAPEVFGIDGSPSEVVVNVARMGVGQIELFSCEDEKASIEIQSSVDLLAGYEVGMPISPCAIELEIVRQDLQWESIRSDAPATLSLGLKATIATKSFTIEQAASETLRFELAPTSGGSYTVEIDVASLIDVDAARAATEGDIVEPGDLASSTELVGITETPGALPPPPVAAEGMNSGCDSFVGPEFRCAPSQQEPGLFWVLTDLISTDGGGSSCTDVCGIGGLGCEDSPSASANRLRTVAQFDEVLEAFGGAKSSACKPVDDMVCTTTSATYQLEPIFVTKECHQPGESGSDPDTGLPTVSPLPFSCDAEPEALECVPGDRSEGRTAELLCPCVAVP